MSKIHDMIAGRLSAKEEADDVLRHYVTGRMDQDRRIRIVDAQRRAQMSFSGMQPIPSAPEEKP